MSVESLQAAVDQLYDFRDHYFERHRLSEAAKKNSDVEAEILATVELLDGLQGEKTV